MTRDVDTFFGLTLTQRPKRLYSARFLAPLDFSNLEDCFVVYSLTNNFDEYFDKEGVTKIGEYSVTLPEIENKKEILNVLKNDGVDLKEEQFTIEQIEIDSFNSRIDSCWDVRKCFIKEKLLTEKDEMAKLVEHLLCQVEEGEEEEEDDDEEDDVGRNKNNKKMKKKKKYISYKQKRFGGRRYIYKLRR